MCAHFIVLMLMLCVFYGLNLSLYVFFGGKPRFLKGILGDVNDFCMEYFIITNYVGGMEILKNGRFTEF